MNILVAKKIILFSFLLINILSAQIVHRLTADRFTHYKLNDWVSYAPALNITSIDIDENYIYFGSQSGGILRYDKYADTWKSPFTTSSGLRSNIIIQVVYNPNEGFLYAKTPAGIDVFKPAENYWQPSSRFQMPTPRTPEESDLRSYRRGEKEAFRFPIFYRPRDSELPDFFTNVYLTYHLGGIIYDQYNREFGFTDRIIDSWQRLWIGTNGFGPMKASMDNVYLESLPQSIPYISPRDVHIDDDDLWIGGLRNAESIGGITHWKRRRNEWHFFEAPFISQLYKDDVFSIDGNERYILFATLLGITVFDKKKDRWKTYGAIHGLEGDKVLDVIVLRDTAYIATEYGINWLDLKSMKISETFQTTLDNVFVNQLAHDGNLLWAATRFGLYSINPTTDDITFHASRAALPDYNLTAIEIIDDQIWIANKNSIAFWDRKKDQWHSFPGLILHAEIRDIAHTKNTLWFATDKGLLKYDQKKNYWRIFTEMDGLISNNTYHIDPEGKQLWISTDKGITSFRWRRKGRID